MDPIDQFGRHLVTLSTRRRFLRRAGRVVTAIGAGLVTLTSLNAQSKFAKAAGECPCAPELGHWCGNCPNDISVNNGCPTGSSYYYGWWCCIGGIGVKCSDCNVSGYLCTCQTYTQITC